MGWFLLAVLAGVFYSLTEIVGKHITDKDSEPLLLGIFSNFYAFLITLFFTFLQPLKLSTETHVILGVLAVGFIYAIGAITYFSSLKITPVSEFTLLTRSYVILLFFGGILVYRDSFSPAQTIGALAIFAAIFILGWGKKGVKFSKGSFLAILTALFFAIAALFDKYLVNNFSTSFYQSLSYATTTFFLLPIIPFSLKRGQTLPKLKTHLLLFAFSGIFAIAGFFLFRSYQAGGTVSITNLLTLLRIPLALIYGFYVFKEKRKLPQKVVSMVLIIFGAYLLK